MNQVSIKVSVSIVSLVILHSATVYIDKWLQPLIWGGWNLSRVSETPDSVDWLAETSQEFESKMSGGSFLQKVFNKISLQKNEKLWLSNDGSRVEDRLRLLAEFSETRFSTQLKLDSAANAKNAKLSAGLREKGNLCYAQGDSERALQVTTAISKSHIDSHCSIVYQF